MVVIPIIKDRAAPGALAAKLAKSKTKRDAQVQAAEERHARKRQSVIQTGTQRITEIRELKSELEVEERELQDVVKSA